MDKEWRKILQNLVREADTQMSTYSPGSATAPEFFYWQGYLEGLEEALRVGPDNLQRAITEHEETRRIQETRIGLPERSSPRMHSEGAIDALRRALHLLHGEKET